MKSSLLIVILLFLTIINVSCMTNATYYRSHKDIDVVIAGAKKHLLSFKFSEKLSYITLHNHQGILLEEFPDLSINIAGDKMLNLPLSSINSDNLKRFILNETESRYIPVGYPEDANQYDLGGVSIIMDSENKAFLGARISGSKVSDYSISRGNLHKKIPIRISEIQELFGIGEVFNVFQH